MREIPYFDFNAQYEGILEYCEEESGWTVLENRAKKYFFIQLHADWMDIDTNLLPIRVEVQDGLERIKLCVALPVIVRTENEERVIKLLKNINDRQHSGFGKFQLKNKTVVYTYTYSYAGQNTFHSTVFRTYLYDCISACHRFQERILDAATEHLELPPSRPFESVFKTPEDSWDFSEMKMAGFPRGMRIIPDEW